MLLFVQRCYATLKSPNTKNTHRESRTNETTIRYTQVEKYLFYFSLFLRSFVALPTSNESTRRTNMRNEHVLLFVCCVAFGRACAPLRSRRLHTLIICAVGAKRRAATATPWRAFTYTTYYRECNACTRRDANTKRRANTSSTTLQ